MKKIRIYWQLFAATFSVSAFTFGGGYVIVPLMQDKFVEKLHWIDEQEMLDIIAISQSLPGPIAVDASVLVGYRIAGVTGGLVALLATVFPPLVILSVVTLFYQAFQSNTVVKAVLKGMQAGISAVIADVVVSGAIKVLHYKSATSIIIMAVSFAAIFFLNINVMLVILACGLFGAATTILAARKGAGRE